MSAGKAAGEPALKTEGEWRLLRMVYADSRMLWANLVLVIIVGALCVSRVMAPWILIWTGAGVLIGLLRVLEFNDFNRRRWSMAQLPAARLRYILMAWLLAIFWGCASLCLVLTEDTSIHLWMVTTQGSVFGSAVARSSPVMLASTGYIVLCLFPLFAICMASGDGHMAVYGLMVILFMAASLRQAASFRDQTVRLLAADEINAALIRSVETVNAKLAQANGQLSAIANIDSLTGLANRRSFDEVLGSEFSRCVRSDSPFSLLMIDIDHFKLFNDKYGHPEGDVCLRQVAACIRKALRRPGDTAARYGGEEFAAVLSCTDLVGAMETAERMRSAIQDLAIPTNAGLHGVVTVSIGVATVTLPSDGDDVTAVISVADRYLYDAKRNDRNRVCGGIVNCAADDAVSSAKSCELQSATSLG